MRVDGEVAVICPTCDGLGYSGPFGYQERCQTCAGTGHVRLVPGPGKPKPVPHRPIPGQGEIPFGGGE